VTEYLSRGELFSIIHDDDIILEVPHKKALGLDIATGMTYLHSLNIIHRDLKTFNLLVSENWQVKVGDFGLAKVLRTPYETEPVTSIGTTAWAAPEVLRHQGYTLKSDIYSFGICLWEIFTREQPFPHLNSPQVIEEVAVKKTP